MALTVREALKFGGLFGATVVAGASDIKDLAIQEENQEVR